MKNCRIFVFNGGKEKMERMTKAQLIELCKKRNLPVTGLKKDLVMRLQRPKKKKQRTILRVVKDGESFYHQETGLIIDPTTKHAVGRKIGFTIRALNRTDIALCKEYNLLFQLPETLEDDREDVVGVFAKEDDGNDSSDDEEYSENEEF